MMIFLMIFTNIAFLLFFIYSSDVHGDITFRQKNMIIDPLTCDHDAEGARSTLLSIDLSLKRMDSKQMEEIFREANKVVEVISELKGESRRAMGSEAVVCIEEALAAQTESRDECNSVQGSMELPVNDLDSSQIASFSISPLASSRECLDQGVAVDESEAKRMDITFPRLMEQNRSQPCLMSRQVNLTF